VAVTFFFVFLIRKGLKRMDSRLNFKAKTIARIVNSLISYIACIFLFFCILHIFGVNTTAMLASVSIISIAVGMGSQSVAADLLAGFFMMLDDTIHVGDYVSAGGVKGTVTDMGIRTTEITDDKGNVVILNNSKVGSVCNMSRNKEKQESENKTNEKE
jgi:small conductance mechanosensitive channel